MSELNDNMGDLIALIRLTLKGDIDTSTKLLNNLNNAEILRTLGMSLGFTAMSLKMLCQLTELTEEQMLQRLITTNEKMRNGDI